VRCRIPRGHCSILDCGRQLHEDQAGHNWLGSNDAPGRQRLADDNDTDNRERLSDEDLRLLFAPASSLGGARPKASVRLKDGRLAIAKFPRRDESTEDCRRGGGGGVKVAGRGGTPRYFPVTKSTAWPLRSSTRISKTRAAFGFARISYCQLPWREEQ
jgi:hypothetical protein